MAAILQLRRNSGQPTILSAGEPYFNTQNGTLHIGISGSAFTTLVNLNDINDGNIKASGNIEGHHGLFSGNLDITGDIRIGGNIYLGDELADSIMVNASLSGSLIPSSGSVFDIGSDTSKYKTIYAETAVFTDVTASYVEFSNVGNLPTLISASIQIDHDSTTNFVLAEHINHSTLSISPGSGLSGGGNLTTSRTLTLNTGSLHFTEAVKFKLNTEGVISGSSQLDNASIDSLHVTTELFVDSGRIAYSENLDIDIPSEIIALVNTGLYDGTFFDYTVKKAGNVRIGTIMAIHDGTGTVTYSDNSTLDIGDTSTIELSVDIGSGNMRLIATTSTNNWVIKCFIRSL